MYKKMRCTECLRACKHLDNAPLMVQGGGSWLGKKYYCCLCSGTRVLNRAKIVELRPEKKFGFIQGKKDNFYFNYGDCDSRFIPHKGMLVDFEVVFLKDKRHSFKAVNIKPVYTR